MKIEGKLMYHLPMGTCYILEQHDGGEVFTGSLPGWVAIPASRDLTPSGELPEGPFTDLGQTIAWLEHQGERERHEAPFYVACIVLRDRSYGGPEEGGWWYDTMSPVIREDAPLPKFFRTRDEAEACCDDMSDWCTTLNEGRPSINSCLSQGAYTTMIYEGEMPCNLPKTRPHYE